MKKLLWLALAAVILIPTFAFRPSAEEAAVRQAVLDYVEGLYDVAPDRIATSVHPDLHKIGFYRDSDDSPYAFTPMSYEQLHQLAGRWNTDNRQQLTDETPKDIVVFDVLDQTASAKLTAQWGVDYFHLAKYEGQWQIVNVLWQSPPPM
ncbi:MAG: nuclear transport factor 2 family protein [Bacteroidota bacterium]